MDPLNLSGVPIETLYQELGASIVRSIAEEWATASLTAEIEDEDDSGTTYGRYYQPGSEQLRGFRTEPNVFFLFRELRRRTRREGAAPWTKAVFTLQRSGAFDLTFDYPDSTGPQ